MWKKLRELEVGTPFHLTSDPNQGACRRIREIRQDGIVMEFVHSKDARPEFWDWKEVEGNNLVWVEDSTE